MSQDVSPKMCVVTRLPARISLPLRSVDGRQAVNVMLKLIGLSRDASLSPGYRVFNDGHLLHLAV